MIDRAPAAIEERNAERVLVCVGPGPGSERLVRAAADLGRRLACPWVAAHVALPVALTESEQARVEGHLRFAESQGGEVARLAGRRTAETLLAFARERCVTRILVGKPHHPHWRDLVYGSLVDALVRGSGDVDVHVITGVEGPAARGPSPRVRPADRSHDVLLAALLIAGTTVLARAAGPVLSDADVVMGYLLAVLSVAYRFGRVAALVASGLSVAAFNFFFVPPFHTFAVADTRNLLTFSVLFGVGILASTIADRLRRQEKDAIAREQRTAALLSLTRAVAAAPDEAAVATAVVQEAARRLARGAVLYAVEGEGLRRVAAAGAEADALDVARAADAARTVVKREELHAVPVLAGGVPMAVLVLIQPGSAVEDLADAYARQAALALTRARHATAAEEASLRARAEELRSALLSTVSHDLRTPLAAITGAATALLDPDARLSDAGRTELLTDVRDEAERLERLVANLLEMTRLTSGALRVRREWVPLEEIVGAAFHRVERTLADRPVTTDLAADLPLVEVDPILLELVLVNLLENSVRHTPVGTAVSVRARRTDGGVEVEVADRGPGLPPGDSARLFEPFVQGGAAPPAGSGLGLAICRGIVHAHGGEIRALAVDGGGASFVMTLPTRGEPPAVPFDDLEGA